jgi:hypothetical protein
MTRTDRPTKADNIAGRREETSGHQVERERWIDSAEITQVFNRYFRALDEKDLEVDRLGRLFTPDARIIRPNDTELVGPEAIGTSHRESPARFESTQHLLTGHDVTVSGDGADIRADLVAMHLWAAARNNANSIDNFFLAGGVITAGLRRTPDGWRITKLENRNVWRAGSGFAAMANTDRTPG